MIAQQPYQVIPLSTGLHGDLGAKAVLRATRGCPTQPKNVWIAHSRLSNATCFNHLASWTRVGVRPCRRSIDRPTVLYRLRRLFQ
jgi:hypothetical protein